MYARASYITAVGFVELPYIVAQTIVFVPVSYFMIGELHRCWQRKLQWGGRGVGQEAGGWMLKLSKVWELWKGVLA